MKRYTFIIVITLVIQLILQVTANIIDNNILWWVPAIVVPIFFISMMMFTLFNENVHDWFNKKINFKDLWKTTRTQ